MSLSHHSLSVMAANPGPPAASAPVNTGAPQKKKSGCGCVGMLLGCGCVTVLVMMLAGVLGTVVVFWQAPRAVGADDWGEVVSLVETATKAASGAGEGISGGGPGGMGGLGGFGGMGEMGDAEGLSGLGGLLGEDQSALAGGSPGAGGQQGEVIDQFFGVLDTPTTNRDLQRFQSNMEQWENSKEVRDFQKIIEQAQELQEQDESIMTGFRTLRLFTQFAFRANDLGEAYANQGDSDFYHLHSRVLAVARLAQMASGNEHDPWEQAVADGLLEDHDENREEFEKSQALLREIMEDGDFDPESLSEEEQMQLMETMGNQFIFIASAINRESLEAWASLSEDERQGIIEQANEPHNFIARALSMAHVDHDSDELYVFPFFGF